MTLTRSVDPGTTVRKSDARRAAFARAQSHSRRVRVLKVLLPTLAVILAVGFVTYSWVVTPASVSIDLGKSVFSDGKLVMENPKLDGFTKNKQRYSITAKKAAQTPKKPDVFDLEGIEAKLPASADNWATVNAATGIYNRAANTINFNSEVTIKTTDGMRATLQDAFINMEKGVMATKKPVDISTDGMRISANSLRVGKGGKLLVFKEHVRMEIQPARLKGDHDTSGEPDG